MKSDSVVPAVLVERITAQYSSGLYVLLRNCAPSVMKKMPSSSIELAA